MRASAGSVNDAVPDGTVRCGEAPTAQPGGDMARILLAIDGSEMANAAVRRAVALLGPEHDYIALSVIRPSMMATTTAPIPSGMPGSLEVVEDPEPGPDELLAQSEHAATEGYEAIEVATHNLHLSAKAVVEAGEPGEVICRVAAAEHVEVIVLGSHGKGLARRLLLGSVSQHVLDNATALVLVLGPRAV